MRETNLKPKVVRKIDHQWLFDTLITFFSKVKEFRVSNSLIYIYQYFLSLLRVRERMHNSPILCFSFSFL